MPSPIIVSVIPHPPCLLSARSAQIDWPCAAGSVSEYAEGTPGNTSLLDVLDMLRAIACSFVCTDLALVEQSMGYGAGGQEPGG